MIARRSFLLGLGSLVAAPAVIRTAGLLMPVRSWLPETLWRQTILGALSKPQFVTLSWDFATVEGLVYECGYGLDSLRRIAA